MVDPRGRIALAVTLAVLLFVSTIAATGVAAAGVDRPTAEPASDGSTILADGSGGERLDHARARSDADQSDRNGSEGVTVADGLRNVEGETQVMVQFEDPSPSTLRQSDDPVETLKERSAASDRALERFASDRAGVRVDRTYWVTNAALVTVDGERTDVEALTNVPGVVEIHPNYDGERLGGASVTASGSPQSSGSAAPAPDNRTGSSQYTYGLEQLNVPQFWSERGTRGDGVHVVVIDSGVDESNHEGLDVIEGGWAHFDANGNQVDTEPHDPGPFGHGTHVSGVVAGNTTDGGKHYGVAPDAELMVASDETPNNGLEMSATLAAFEWALDHEKDVRVITTAHSFGAGQSEFVDVVKNARASGIVVTGAVGNDHHGTAGTPGDGYDIVSVGAVDSNGDVTEFSGGLNVTTADRWSDPPAHWPDQYTLPTVTAPGKDVVSASVGGGYGPSDGTSYAAPHVAGVSALLLANEPSLTPEELEQRLVDTAVHPDGENAQGTRYGHGIVDVAAAAETPDARITGVVTVDGQPASGVTVETESGVSTTTNQSGAYSLAVAAGNHTVVASTTGYVPVSSTVTVAGNETATVDLSIDQEATELSLATDAPATASAGETITLSADVLNADAVTVSAAEPFDDPGATTLTVDGETVAYGETVSVGGANETVSIGVTTDADYFGKVTLEVAASGNGSTSATGSSTTVHGDVVTVPTDTGNRSLEEVLSIASSGVEIRLENGTYDVGHDPENPYVPALALEDNVTLTAVEGASPTIDVDHTGSAAIELTGEGATLSDVTIHGGGIDTAVRVLASGSGEVTGTEISGTSRTGIHVLGSADRIADNTLTGSGEQLELISIDDPHDPPTVVNNTLSGGDVGVAVRAASPVTVRSNEITGSRKGIKAHDYGNGGTAAHRIVDNRIVAVTQDGIELDWATGVTIANNEIVDPDSIGINAREADDLAIRNNVIRRPSATGTTLADISVRQGNGVTIEDNVLEDSFLTASGTNDTLIANTTVSGPDSGISVSGVRHGDGRILHRSTNVTVTGTNASDGTDAVYVHSGVADVSVEHPDTVAKLGDDQGALRNVTIAGETPFSANGTEIELRPAGGSVSGPAGYEQVSTALDVNRTAADARLDLTVDLAAAPVDHLYEGTLGLYANDTAAGDALGNATIEGDRLVVTDVTADATVAAFGEPAATLEGYVTADGSPHEGATVTVARNGTPIAETTTDAYGPYEPGAPYELTVPADEIVVTVTDRAHTTNSTTIAPAANETVVQNVSIQRVEDYFGVDDLGVPAETDAGSTYTVSANVSNLGTQNGTETVQYVVDGEVVASETVELNASDRTEIGFEHSIESAGTYEHGIRTDNETRTLTLSVASADDNGGGGGGGGGYSLPPATEPSPSFSLASIELGTDEVAVGESVTVDVEVDNDGDANGEYTATLTADGRTLDTETVSVNSNWHERLTLSASFDEPGTYQLAVDGEPAGTVTVSGEADVEVTDANVDQSEIAPGETVTVTATVENTGAVGQSTEVALAMDGVVAETTEVTVPAGETETVTFETTLDEPGTVSLTVGTESAGMVIVEESDGDDGSSGQSDGTPGFGALAALLGVLLGTVAATRRATN